MSEKSKKSPKRKRVHSPFSANLKSLLEERGVSIRGAAELCGINPAVVHAWLNGAQPQDLNAVLKLCKALACDFQAILTGEPSRDLNLANLKLSDLYEIEDEPSLSGMFLIQAKRLKRKGSGNGTD